MSGTPEEVGTPDSPAVTPATGAVENVGEGTPAAESPKPASEVVGGGADTPQTSATPGVSAPAVAVPEVVTAPEAVTVEPAPRIEPQSRDELLTHAARIVCLAALIGGSVAAWFRVAFRSPWLDTFLLENALDDPDQRHSLILTWVLGLLSGAAVGAATSIWRVRKRLGLAAVEHWAWFLSPLILAPLAPVLFRPKVWQNRHDVLLPTLLLILLVFEKLAYHCLSNVPAAVKSYVAEAIGQVPQKLRRHGPLVIVIAAAAAYAAFFIFYTIRWHYKLRTGNYDLSINNNLMFGGLHGRFLESPVVFPKDPPRYLANHAKFGAYLFLPIYALFPRAETLLVIQSTFVGFGALPLFALARRHVSQWMALVVVLAYLSYYPLHGASFSEFQAIPVAAFFVFTIAWAADARRYPLLAVALVIALSMREDVSIGLAVLGGFLLLTGYRPLPGLVIAGVSAVYFVFLRFYIMDNAGTWWFPNMYKELWADGEKGFNSVIKTMITNPTFLLSKLIVEKKLVYMLHLLVPLAFLPVRRWYLWAALIPGALLTLLVTNYDPPVTFSFHYVMHWAPYLFMAAILALKALAGAGPDGPFRARAAAAALVCSTLVLSFNYGAFPRREGSFKAGFSRIEFGYSQAEHARYLRLLDIIQSIPPDASVAATEKVGPHVSSRLSIFTMRNGPQTGEYILASSRELKLSKTRPTLKEALESGRYGVMRRVGDFALMKLGHPTDGNAALIADWEL